MKTAQIMNRPFLDGHVRQNHKTLMFNLNDLAQLYDEVDGPKKLQNWSRTSASRREFMDEICREEKTTPDKLLASKKGRYGGTWAHPLLMVDFAMYLSAEFKYKALQWVLDGLCSVRDDTGDEYRRMCGACMKFLEYRTPWQYAEESRMVNRVAGVVEGTRNELSEAQLRKVRAVQRANARLIERGHANMFERECLLREGLEAARLFS
jgi:hypothetical protein